MGFSKLHCDATSLWKCLRVRIGRGACCWQVKATTVLKSATVVFCLVVLFSSCNKHIHRQDCYSQHRFFSELSHASKYTCKAQVSSLNFSPVGSNPVSSTFSTVITYSVFAVRCCFHWTNLSFIDTSARENETQSWQFRGQHVASMGAGVPVFIQTGSYVWGIMFLYALSTYPVVSGTFSLLCLTNGDTFCFKE